MFVDADHASDETTRKSMSCCHTNLSWCLIDSQQARQATVALSSGESELCALSMGCAAGMLVMSCWKGTQLEASDVDVDGPEMCTDSSFCQRKDEAVRSGANRTHGHATKRLVLAQRDRHKHEYGRRKFFSSTTRRTLLALMLLWFGEFGWQR